MQIFDQQDLIMANHLALVSLLGTGTAEELTRRLGRLCPAGIVVGAGAEGCYYSEDGESAEHLPAIPVEAVDAVGAGDAFHGGLLYALAQGREFAEGLEVARRCAALNCLTFGAREGMPTFEEFARFDPPSPT